jgi:HAD superfamily hydrolase (TIGR01549 family)
MVGDAGCDSAVLFDIGDTLVHRPEVGPGRRIADALGLDRDAARTISSWLFRDTFTSPAALAKRLRDTFALDGTIDEAVATIWHAQEHEPVETVGATACVAAARASGARVGIVSNIWAPYESGFRRACPAIVSLVETWQLSYRAGVAKPDPALFRAALAALGVAAEDAIMVGDSLDKDVRPALALGMHAIWVTEREDAVATLAAWRGDMSGAGSDADDAHSVVAPDLPVAQTAIVRFLAERRLV